MLRYYLMALHCLHGPLTTQFGCLIFWFSSKSHFVFPMSQKTVQAEDFIMINCLNRLNFKIAYFSQFRLLGTFLNVCKGTLKAFQAYTLAGNKCFQLSGSNPTVENVLNNARCYTVGFNDF